jgi:hypothetical protein
LNSSNSIAPSGAISERHLSLPQRLRLEVTASRREQLDNR